MQTTANTRWAGFHGLLGHIDFVRNKKKYGPSNKQSTKCSMRLISTTIHFYACRCLFTSLSSI
jgi:hypothetical protein